MQYVHLQKHVAAHRWQFDSLNIGRCPGGHHPVAGRASADLLRVFSCSWRLSDIVRCPTGHRTVPGWAPLKSYDNFFIQIRPVPVRCVQTPAGPRPGTVRSPADVILPSITLPNAVRAPWNFK